MSLNHYEIDFSDIPESERPALIKMADNLSNSGLFMMPGAARAELFLEISTEDQGIRRICEKYPRCHLHQIP